MNKVILLGRLGQNPETITTQSGMTIANISLATSRKYKDEEQTQWHRLKAFDKTAEIMAKHLTKGDQALIEGRIEYGQYEKDGVTKYTTDIIVDRFEFVGSKQTEPVRKPVTNETFAEEMPF